MSGLLFNVVENSMRTAVRVHLYIDINTPIAVSEHQILVTGPPAQRCCGLHSIAHAASDGTSDRCAHPLHEHHRGTAAMPANGWQPIYTGARSSSLSLAPGYAAAAAARRRHLRAVAAEGIHCFTGPNRARACIEITNKRGCGAARAHR